MCYVLRNGLLRPTSSEIYCKILHFYGASLLLPSRVYNTLLIFFTYQILFSLQAAVIKL